MNSARRPCVVRRTGATTRSPTSRVTGGWRTSRARSPSAGACDDRRPLAWVRRHAGSCSSALATLGRRRPARTARTVEPHWDAVAILDQAGGSWPRGRDVGRLRGGATGHPPRSDRRCATATGGCPAPSRGARWPTGSRTPWSPPTSSGDQPALFAVDLRDERGVGRARRRGARAVCATCTTSTVTFDDVPATAVGATGLVPRAARVRLGWHRRGGRVVRRRGGRGRRRCGTPRAPGQPDQVALMHLGACDVDLHATLLALRDAAAADRRTAAPTGAAGSPPRRPGARARRPAAPSRCSTTVGHALGPGTAGHGRRARRARRRPHPVRAPAPRRARPGRAGAARSPRPDARDRRCDRGERRARPVPPRRRRAPPRAPGWARDRWDDIGVLDLPARRAALRPGARAVAPTPTTRRSASAACWRTSPTPEPPSGVLVASDGERVAPAGGAAGPGRAGRSAASGGGARGGVCWRRPLASPTSGCPTAPSAPHEELRWSRRCGAAPAPTPWCSPRGSPTGTPTTTRSGRASAEAVSHSGADLAHYPIWLWHWGTPDACRGWTSWRTRRPRGRRRGAKRAALDEFPSQTTAWASTRRPAGRCRAVLGPASLDRGACRLVETLDRPDPRPAAACDRPARRDRQRRGPRQFDRMYDDGDDPWAFDGSFYEERRARSCWPSSDAVATVVRSRSVAPTAGSPQALLERCDEVRRARHEPPGRRRRRGTACPAAVVEQGMAPTDLPPGPSTSCCCPRSATSSPRSSCVATCAGARPRWPRAVSWCCATGSTRRSTCRSTGCSCTNRPRPRCALRRRATYLDDDLRIDVGATRTRSRGARVARDPRRPRRRGDPGRDEEALLPGLPAVGRPAAVSRAAAGPPRHRGCRSWSPSTAAPTGSAEVVGAWGVASRDPAGRWGWEPPATPRSSAGSRRWATHRRRSTWVACTDADTVVPSQLVAAAA